jgi:hypothetical protein
MDWNVHRRLNKASLSGESPTAAFGSSVVYASPPGFVHTSYALLGTKPNAGRAPPTDLFKTHNEWFWPRDDPTECTLTPHRPPAPHRIFCPRSC